MQYINSIIVINDKSFIYKDISFIIHNFNKTNINIKFDFYISGIESDNCSSFSITLFYFKRPDEFSDASRVLKTNLIRHEIFFKKLSKIFFCPLNPYKN